MDTNILRGKHIFIVEDNLENRIVFQMVFIKYGAHVDFERWGRGLISRLKTTPFPIDLIILDLMLKDNVSGFDVFDDIRALPQFARTPIVAVSAMDASVAIPKTREKGFNGFIAKPIDNDLFPQQIAALLNGEAVWYAGAGVV